VRDDFADAVGDDGGGAEVVVEVVHHALGASGLRRCRWWRRRN
jgi:hypothetical protein